MAGGRSLRRNGWRGGLYNKRGEQYMYIIVMSSDEVKICIWLTLHRALGLGGYMQNSSVYYSNISLNTFTNNLCSLEVIFLNTRKPRSLLSGSSYVSFPNLLFHPYLHPLSGPSLVLIWLLVSLRQSLELYPMQKLFTISLLFSSNSLVLSCSNLPPTPFSSHEVK